MCNHNESKKEYFKKYYLENKDKLKLKRQKRIEQEKKQQEIERKKNIYETLKIENGIFVVYFD